MRTTKRFRLAPVVAIAAVAALAAGCSSNGGGASTSSDTTSAPAETSAEAAPETPAEEPAPPADGATAINFWQRHFSDDEDAWYKAQVEAFNAAQTDVVVAYESIPEDAWDQKMTAAQASGTAPDVYTRAYNQIFQLVDQAAIADMTNLLPQAAWDDLQSNILDMVSVDGAHYAYPVLVEPSMVLYYRTDLFEQAGLDPTNPPTTFAELIAAGEALKAILPDGSFALGTSQTAAEMGWSTWGIQNGLAGHLPISGDWSTAQADDAAYAPLFDLLRDLYDKDIIPKQKLADYVDPAPYGEGKLAMMICGSWASGELMRTYPDLVANTAVAKVPLATADNTKSSATLGGWTLVVDAKTTKTDAAGAFISWLLADDTASLADYFKMTGYSKFPARKSVDAAIAADPSSETANPFRAIIAADIVPTSIPEAIYPYDIALGFSDQLEAAMLGKDTATAQADAQTAITDLIAQLGIAGTGPGE